MGFFSDGSDPLGPAIRDDVVAQAQLVLGVRLPDSYVALLREKNGGTPARRCFRMTHATSWASDHIEVSCLLGIGYPEGLDGEFGSQYLATEWGYPPMAVVIFDTPSGGHDTVMLDYSTCGPSGEPRVIYVDEDRVSEVVAERFDLFVAGLYECRG